MTNNSKRETIINEEIDLEDVTYQEIINEINGIYNYLTLEINKQIKQVEFLTDEERWTKEKARREAQIISFRGAQIPRFEANILQEIEKQLNKQFKKIDDNMKLEQMDFSVENQRITGIGLCECFIGVLPESIGELKSLQHLQLVSNELTTLPESIGKLKSFQFLSLGGNRLKTLPESMTKLKSLQHLFLDETQLKTLPESIVNLSSLKSLWLQYNQLTTLPESIGNLTSLHRLDLSSNQLTTLPESIGKLKSLQFLSLFGNKLMTLPDSIGNLSSLKRLNISNNPLARKPDSRTKSILKQLKKNNIDIGPHILGFI